MSAAVCAIERGQRYREIRDYYVGHCIQIEQFFYEDGEPIRVGALFPPGRRVLFYCLEGTLLFHRADGQGWDVLSGGSSAMLLADQTIKVIVGRGVVKGFFFSWDAAYATLLNDWFLDERRKLESNAVLAHVPKDCATIAGALDVLKQSTQGDQPIVEPRILGALQMLCVAAMQSQRESALAQVPTDAPESLKQLANLVKDDPLFDWSLKDAADQAGYSQFHLSRTFRNVVGYGFPEYVERCRIELAMKAMNAGNHDMQHLTSKSGFHNANALRESMKKVLGVLPSELKRLVQN